MMCVGASSNPLYVGDALLCQLVQGLAAAAAELEHALAGELAQHVQIILGCGARPPVGYGGGANAFRRDGIPTGLVKVEYCS